MGHAVKLKEPSTYEGQVDYKTIESWIYSVDNYYSLVEIARRDPTSMLCGNLAYKTSCTMVMFKLNQFGLHKIVYTQDCNP